MKKINKITGIDFMFKPEFKNDYIIVKSTEVDDVCSFQCEDGSVLKQAAVTLWCKWNNQVKRFKLYFDVKEVGNHITASEMYRIACNATNSLMIAENMTYNDAFTAIANGIKAIVNRIEDVLDCNLTLMKAA